MWTVFVLVFLIASLPTNLVYILIFTFVFLGFLFVGSSYFAAADGHDAAATGLKKAGGVFCFLAGLVGWLASQVHSPYKHVKMLTLYVRYLTLHLLIKDSLYDLPLGDTSAYFPKTRKRE